MLGGSVPFVQDADDVVTRLVEIGAELVAHRERLSALAAERRRLVIELHDGHGWSDATIARALGVTRGAVEKLRASR